MSLLQGDPGWYSTPNAEFLVLCQSSDRIVWVHEATILCENAASEIAGEDVLASRCEKKRVKGWLGLQIPINMAKE